jgi:hypothetical protein
MTTRMEAASKVAPGHSQAGDGFGPLANLAVPSVHENQETRGFTLDIIGSAVCATLPLSFKLSFGLVREGPSYEHLSKSPSQLTFVLPWRKQTLVEKRHTPAYVMVALGLICDKVPTLRGRTVLPAI